MMLRLRIIGLDRLINQDLPLADSVSRKDDILLQRDNHLTHCHPEEPSRALLDASFFSNKRFLKKLGIGFGMGLICLFLSGCQLTKNHIQPNDPAYAPITPAQMTPPPVNNGSLYREGFGLSLYEDNTARRVGDVLTVELTEKMKSDSLSESTSERATSINSANPTILGGAFSNLNLPGVLNMRDRGKDASVAVTNNSDYEGKGSAKESHNLTDGYITVTVSEVFPNGNLRIRGEKWLSLNEDDKYIRITGIVRPQDIDSSNTVKSMKIADARITYGGKGLVSENSAPGWLARFFLSPLWPF